MKKLKEFAFGTAAAKQTHDWAKLLDGSIYQLEEGKDFTCKPATMIALARLSAKKAGKGVRTAKVDNGVVIQAVEQQPEGGK